MVVLVDASWDLSVRWGYIANADVSIFVLNVIAHFRFYFRRNELRAYAREMAINNNTNSFIQRVINVTCAPENAIALFCINASRKI